MVGPLSQQWSHTLSFRKAYVREYGRLAQLVERLLYTENVGGSSPSSLTLDYRIRSRAARYAKIAQLVEHTTENCGVTGSSPVLGTNLLGQHKALNQKRMIRKDRPFLLFDAQVDAQTIFDCLWNHLKPDQYRVCPYPQSETQQALCEQRLRGLQSPAA